MSPKIFLQFVATLLNNIFSCRLNPRYLSVLANVACASSSVVARYLIFRPRIACAAAVLRFLIVSAWVSADMVDTFVVVVVCRGLESDMDRAADRDVVGVGLLVLWCVHVVDDSWQILYNHSARQHP